MSKRRPRSSRQRYREFVQDYKQRRLDEVTQAAGNLQPSVEADVTAAGPASVLTAMAIIPGAMLMSFASARRIRPIYRAVRKDVEQIDGRVGETFTAASSSASRSLEPF